MIQIMQNVHTVNFLRGILSDFSDAGISRVRMHTPQDYLQKKILTCEPTEDKLSLSLPNKLRLGKKTPSIMLPFMSDGAFLPSNMTKESVSNRSGV